MRELIVKKLTFSQSVTGLIFRKPQNVYFRTHFGIHTFFMKYPIDVILLDESGKVMKIKKNLKPNKIFLWNFKYSRVVEMPEGTILKMGIDSGDKILLKFTK